MNIILKQDVMLGAVPTGDRGRCRNFSSPTGWRGSDRMNMKVEVIRQQAQAASKEGVKPLPPLEGLTRSSVPRLQKSGSVIRFNGRRHKARYDIDAANFAADDTSRFGSTGHIASKKWW